MSTKLPKKLCKKKLKIIYLWEIFLKNHFKNNKRNFPLNYNYNNILTIFILFSITYKL